MQKSIKALYPGTKGFHLLDIFGYTTKGMPGLEIVGLNKHGRSIKEKLIYLTRQAGRGLPVRRYILCVEQIPSLGQKSDTAICWLELPLLILFWTLAEQINFHHLEQCIGMGMININGEISLYPNFANLVKQTPCSMSLRPFIKSTHEEDGFSLEELLGPFSNLSFVDTKFKLDGETLYQFQNLRQVL